MVSPRRPSEPALLLLSGVLLVPAGAAIAGAAAIRWAPCVAGAEIACVLAQDHARDYDLVGSPFESTPGAVLLAGVASLLLAVLWTAWATRARGAARVAAVLTVAVVGTTATGQLLAAVSGGALGVLPAEPGAPYLVAVLLQTLQTLLPIVAAALLLRGADPASRVAWIALLVGLVLAYPLVEYTVFSAGGASYDTPTGFGWLRAGTLVLPGIVFLVAGLRARRTSVGSGRPTPAPTPLRAGA